MEFRGLRVGTVTDIGFDGSLDTGWALTVVTIAIEPERVPLTDAANDSRFAELSGEEKLAQVRTLMERSVELGLRARLQTGNLLTGQMFVELDFMPDEAEAEVDYSGPLPELPTVLSQILAKLERLPLDEIGGHLQRSAAGLERLLDGRELQQAVAHLARASDKLDRVLGAFDARTVPMLDAIAGAGRDVSALSRGAREAVANADGALRNLENLTADSGPVGRELPKVLEELSAAARSIRLMAEYLERHPEALIQGKPAY